MQQQWWQEESARFLEDALTHFNHARRQSEPLARGASLFDALNRTWDALYFYQRKHNLLPPLEANANARSDNRELRELLVNGICVGGANDLINSDEIRAFASFEPQIMNHDTLRNADYDPHDISDQLRKKASEEHQQLRNAYNRLSRNPEDIELKKAVLRKLSQILYVVRSNRAHGEKTPKGPDTKKYQRDYLVCTACNPVIEKLFAILWEEPDRRLAAYGTLRPWQSNHSVVSGIQGSWRSGTITGRLDQKNSYPMFTWDISGNPVRVDVLTSDELPTNLIRLDQFEGPEYERTWLPVSVGGQEEVCNVYCARLPIPAAG